jgi:hypothetical protein
VTESGKAPRPDRATGAPPSPQGTIAAGAPGSASAIDKEDGFITLRVQKFPTTVNVKWSRAEAKEGANAPLPTAGTDLENGYKFEFDMDVTVDIPDADPQSASPPRLKNLGYVQFPSDPDNIRAFQHDYKPQFGSIVEDGTLNTATVNAIQTTHDACAPLLKAGSQIVVKR